MSKLRNRSYKLTALHPPIAFILQSKPRARNPLLFFDEKTQTNRSLRYAVNQKSPFMDEQDGNAIVEPIIFENGMLNVPSNNPVLQMFLEYHPAYGIHFVELDLSRDAQAEVDKMDSEADALIKAKNLTIEEHVQVARAGLSRDTTKMSSAEVKRDVMVFAKNNPVEFLSLLDDPAFKMHDFVGQCVEFKLISFRNKGRDIYFNLAHNKSKMLTIPFGENKIHALSKYLQTDDGLTSYELLKGSMEKYS